MPRPSARAPEPPLTRYEAVSKSVVVESYTGLVDWIATYDVETEDRPWDLGEPATLTVILRDLATDARTHAFIPIEPTARGDAQREAILRSMAGRFPDARWKTYNEEKQIASFVGRNHLYLVMYEEHDVDETLPAERPRLFAV